MRCLKTGFDAQLLNHGMYLHGDAYLQPVDLFRMSDFGDGPDERNNKHGLILRVSSYGYTSDVSKFHLIIDKEDHWFDRSDRLRDTIVGTMIVLPSQWRWLGFDGTFSESFGTFLNLGINPGHD